MAAFAVLCSAADVAALAVTEANVDNDPEGRYVQRLVDGMVSAIGSGLRGDGARASG